jgi:hypothetical protein
MPVRRVLILSAHQLSAFVWQGGSARAESTFENTPEGFAAFATYLSAEAKSVFTLVVNVAEESFQLETIPFLQSRDRSAVIARKLAQLFYTTPYTAAFSLGYEKTRRKDERLLLAAITAPALLDPWISAIRDARIALTGIHSLPILYENLLRKLKIQDERCILLTVQDQSVRETYFEQGRLHFSRLSPLVNTSIGGVAQGFSTEAVKLQQYLLSQRLIARNQPLRAIIVAHPQAVSAVEASCVSTESLDYRIVTTETCRQQAGFKGTLADSHLDALIAHLAIAVAPPVQFAKEALRHDYRIWQIRNALYGLGAVALVGCSLFAGKKLFDAYQLDSEVASVAARAQEARTRYDEIRRTFPQVPTTNETLRQIMDRYAELERGGASSPEGFYRDISAALTKSPNVDIDAISWKGGATGNPTAPGVATLPSGATQTAQVRGTINLGVRATPRQTLAAFDQFVADLRATPRLDVKVLQQPFDIDSGKALKSGGDSSIETSVRPFALEITRSIQP